jgi:hypothetical protein
MRRCPVPASGAYAFVMRKPTAFPSSATFGHPLSPARAMGEEEASTTENEPT